MESHPLRTNLVYLTEHLTNILEVLNRLVQNNLLSNFERDTILSYRTPLEKNTYLLSLLERKDWTSCREIFISALQQTNNEYCVNVLNGVPPPERKYRALPSKWWPQPIRLTNSFVERKAKDGISMIEKIRTVFEKTNKIVLHGMGGVGKSAIAKWYTHHFEGNYDHIIWLDCDEEVISTTFQELALGLRVADWGIRTLETIARKCYEILRSCTNCLLIFDTTNCNKIDDIRKFLPNNADSRNLFSIITSRCGYWGEEQFGNIEALQIGPFTEMEGMNFLSKNLKGLESSYHLQKRLLKLVGNLPLALQISVTNLNQNSAMNLKSYREEYLIEDTINSADPYDNKKSLCKFAQQSLELVKNTKSSELAMNILMTFAFIYGNAVPLIFFAKVEAKEVFAIQNAVKILEQHSLVTRNNYVLSIHSLLQQTIRVLMSPDEKNIILRKIFDTQGFFETKLLPYLYAQKDNEINVDYSHIRGQLIMNLDLAHFYHHKRYTEGVALSQMICDSLKYGRNEEMLSSKLNHGIFLSLDGRPEESLEILENLSLNQNMLLENGDIYVGLKSLDTAPNKLAVHLWALHNYTQLDSLAKRLNKQKFMDLPRSNIEVVDNEDECILPVDIDLFRNVGDLSFFGTKILVDQNRQTQINSLEKLILFHPKFENSNGEAIENVNFLHITTFRIKKLVIWNFDDTERDLNVDISLLPNTIQEISIVNAEISWGSQGSTTTSPANSLILKGIKNSQAVNSIFPRFTELETLVIVDVGENFTLDVSLIPNNIKRLHMDSVKIKNESNLKIPLKLQTLLLENYKRLKTVEVIVQEIPSQTLMLGFLGGQQLDQSQLLDQLSVHQTTIALQTCGESGKINLSKYGIPANSIDRYYLFINGECKAIDEKAYQELWSLSDVDPLLPGYSSRHSSGHSWFTMHELSKIRRKVQEMQNESNIYFRVHDNTGLDYNSNNVGASKLQSCTLTSVTVGGIGLSESKFNPSHSQLYQHKGNEQDPNNYYNNSYWTRQQHYECYQQVPNTYNYNSGHINEKPELNTK